MRVRKVRESVADALEGNVTLRMHLNSDKSMALGTAFRGANINTSFKVRRVGMMDINSFPVAVDLTVLAAAEVTGGNGLFGVRKKKTEAVKDCTSR